jgi:phosphoglucosamine mutase
MVSLFGTDGIRGRANGKKVNVHNALQLGLVLGNLIKKYCKNHVNRVIIGKDTRRSCYMIENAVSAGLLAAGVDVFLVGPLPSPAVSFLTTSMRCDIGIMISASHNQYYDNGIKIFNADGEKISDEFQNELEVLMRNDNYDSLYCDGDKIGSCKRIDDVAGRYIEHLKSTFPKNERLDGMKIAIDTANGAAYKIAHTVLWELGADVICIGNCPNGYNINLKCGATDMKMLQQSVVEHKADIGIALDGDADRIGIVDEKGDVVHGDLLFGIIAKFLKTEGWLSSSVVVSTIIANGALEGYLSGCGLELIRADVGDRQVYKKMKENKINFGGETSGHIIFGDYASTGDGLMAALQMLAIAKQSGKKISECMSDFTLLPYLSDEMALNIDITDELRLGVQKISAEVDKKLSKNGGRAIVRFSGTELKIRIHIEGKISNDLTNYMSEIKDSLLRIMHK